MCRTLHHTVQMRPWRRPRVFPRKLKAFTVQLDSAALATLVIGTCWLIKNRVRPALLAGQLALAVVAALGLVFQLAQMAWVYELVPGLAFLPFPWRLLALIVPAAIAGAFRLVGEIMQHNRRIATAAGILQAWELI
jgi:apolipoprotein N-acyltransferase